MLKRWEPNTPVVRKNYSTYVLWINIHGLPLEWFSEEVVEKVAEDTGKVLEVKVETK